MTDAPDLDALIQAGDDAFGRGDFAAANAAWVQAVNIAPFSRRAQIVSRFEFARSPRAGRLMKVMKALEEAFPGTSPYVSEGLAVWMKTNSFLTDVPFLNTAAKHAGLLPLAGWHWNLQTVIWAAQQARPLDGDFVELGVFRGHTTAVVAEHLGFGGWDRKWFLYDTFDGVPEDQLDDGWDRANVNLYKDTFSVEEVQARFAAYPNIEVIKGRVPEILHERCPERIALLHLDLNNVAAEMAAIAFLFDRLVPGGIIVFDDYGWAASASQMMAEKAWFRERGLAILELPTGQGLFVKGTG